MRSFATLLHRWAGLATALFLFITGLTGAIISWDHELDDLLNSHLTHVSSQGPAKDPLELARQVEDRDPRAVVTFVPLALEPDESLALGVTGRVDPATGKAFELGYNQVFVDPVTGAELGKREWGAVWPVTSENLVSFLYVLHFSLHIPEFWGIDHWGLWLLGVVAIVWTIDCFVGLYLTLPARRRQAAAKAASKAASGPSWWQRWKPAWKVRWSGGSYKLNFDLHRAFSLWTWVLLLILAFTAFSLNLYREVFFPMMELVTEVTPGPFDKREETPEDQPIEPRLGFAEAIATAKAEAARRGWEEPAGSVFYARHFGIYGVSFYYPGGDHGVGGVGPAALYFDGQDGSLLGDSQPWKGTAGDIFVQAQLPLHSGRILGLPGRILISAMGLVIAMLSVTGVIIWWRKRAARVRSLQNKSQRQADPADSEILPSR
ncbi:PepSY-associated TM region [compost metagenome]